MMIGGIVFVIVFVLFLILSLAGIAIPLGDMIVGQFIPDILQTEYVTLVEGIINGVIFGIIVWVIFSIIKMMNDRSHGPKEVLVKIENEPINISEPSSARIIEIEGIGSEYSKKLNNANIKTTDDLLNTGGTKQGRKNLAEKTCIAETIILEWVNMADLFRIKGIGEEYSDLLKEAGVSTVVELSRRNPENLHETLVGVNEAKKRVQRPPSLSQIKDWIEQAKTLERKVDY
jgi:predicted flap endonuclease-1-like 5' DNA nuclease